MGDVAELVDADEIGEQVEEGRVASPHSVWQTE